MNADIPWWQNLTENKLVVQVIHRTLATAAIGYILYKGAGVMKLNVSRRAKVSMAMFMAAALLQGDIGMLTVWGSVPIEKASMHQLGAMTLLTTGILALGACRRVDHRHLKNMLYKFKMEDPKNYKILMKNADADTKQPLKELQKY